MRHSRLVGWQWCHHGHFWPPPTMHDSRRRLVRFEFRSRHDRAPSDTANVAVDEQRPDGFLSLYNGLAKGNFRYQSLDERRNFGVVVRREQQLCRRNEFLMRRNPEPTTAVPAAIASTTGNENPSDLEGTTTQ